MWRAFFLGIGLYLMIAGRSAWRWTVSSGGRRRTRAGDDALSRNRLPEAERFPPAPWVPWSLLSTGAVVCLYSFTIPKRMGGGKK